MKHKAFVFIAITAIVALGLVVAHRVLAGGSFAPVSQSGPPVRLDGAGASVSAVNGPTVSGGGFTFEPSSFSPTRLTQNDVDNIPYWDTDSGHIGVPGIDNGTVYALAVADDGAVYVGGDFTDAGGVAAADYIAKWNSADGWSAVGSGVNGTVKAIAVAPNGHVYVGGEFTSPGTRIAR